MATNNNCSVLAKDTPVCKFHKKLTDEHALHTEGLRTSKIKIEAWEIVRAYAICSLAKYKQTFEYYRDLTNFELFDMHDSAEKIDHGHIEIAQRPSGQVAQCQQCRVYHAQLFAEYLGFQRQRCAG